MKPSTLTLALAGALTLSAAVAGETSTRVDGYTIHHNAITTDSLAPQVASSYGIQRSTHRALLNVSLIKEAPGTTGRSTPAKVSTHAQNLLGQHWDIPMREIKDGEAYYYIADFPVKNEDTIDFIISVTPEGQSKPYQVKMTQQFFTK